MITDCRTSRFYHMSVLALLAHVAVFIGGPSRPNTETNIRDGLTKQDRSGAISVHGEWTIEVRDRLGQPLRRMEFENALTQCGMSILSGLISREVTEFIAWKITLSVAVNGSERPPADFLTEPVQPLYPTSGRDAGKIVLQATVNWPGGEINNVGTVLNFEGTPTSVGVESCWTEPGTAIFTSKTVSLPVETGQEVFVNVALSYS